MPDWIPQEAWQAYVEMRKKMRKPLTDYAIKLAVSKLEQMMLQGQDVQAVLDQSILNGWQGLFPVQVQVKASVQHDKFDPVSYVNRNRRYEH